MDPARLGFVPRPSPTVLVVDDDPGVLAVAASMVSRCGYTVLTATDGNDAFQMLQGKPIDALICDMRMPQYDGEWLLRQMRASRMSTPVIIMTGLNELDPALTLGPGVVAYVMKPYRMAELAAAIRAALPAHAPGHSAA